MTDFWVSFTQRWVSRKEYHYSRDSNPRPPDHESYVSSSKQRRFLALLFLCFQMTDYVILIACTDVRFYIYFVAGFQYVQCFDYIYIYYINFVQQTWRKLG